MSGHVVSLSAGNWTDQVENASVPVMVDFGASWCPPCQRLAPVLEELAGEYSGVVKIGAVDVDADSALAAQFGIKGLPTLVVFKDGQAVDRIVGFQPKQELKSRIDSLLS